MPYFLVLAEDHNSIVSCLTRKNTRSSWWAGVSENKCTFPVAPFTHCLIKKKISSERCFFFLIRTKDPLGLLVA